MKAWRKGILALVWAALASVGHSQTATSIWDPVVSGPYDYVQDISNLGSTTVDGEQAIKVNMLRQWAQFGQRYTNPVDWSAYQGVSIAITNYEAFPVSIGMRVNLNAAGTDCLSGAATIRAGETMTLYLDAKGFDANAARMSLPPAGVPKYHERITPWQGFRTLNSVYSWFIYNRETVPVNIAIAAVYGQRKGVDLTNTVDRYGQYTGASWANKISTDANLLTARDNESLQLAQWADNPEILGSNGLPKSTATGKWRLAKNAAGKWYFYTPAGKPFWSLGVTSTNTGNDTIIDGRRTMFTGLPQPGDLDARFYGTTLKNGATLQTFNFYQANLRRKYGESWATDWQNTTIARLRKWGFNTLGQGAVINVVNNANMPYTVQLSTQNFPVKLSTPYAVWRDLPDPYSASFMPWMRTAFAAEVNANKANPLWMGTYVDSELTWGFRDDPVLRYMIPLSILQAPATQQAKISWIAILKAKYTTITALNTAWGTNYASWTAMQTSRTGVNTSAMTGAMLTDMGDQTVMFATVYFSRVKQVLNELGVPTPYLGAQECPSTCPNQILAAEQKFVDVISMNYYDDPDLVDWALIGALSKPVLFSEFSYVSFEGNTFWGRLIGKIGCRNQTDRAATMLKFASRALAAKNVVGMHWFRYADYPISAHSNNVDNSPYGIMDTTDQPSMPLVNAFRKLSSTMYSTRGN